MTETNAIDCSAAEGERRPQESSVQPAAMLQMAIEALDEEIRYNARMADIFRSEMPYVAASYRRRETLFEWVKSKVLESTIGAALQVEQGSETRSAG